MDSVGFHTPANWFLDRKQNVLGIIVKVDGQQRFYFATSSMGNSITAHGKPHITQTRDFYVHSLMNTINFRDVLTRAGAKVVSELPVEGEFINLSPEALDRTTILDLMKG